MKPTIWVYSCILFNQQPIMDFLGCVRGKGGTTGLQCLVGRSKHVLVFLVITELSHDRVKLLEYLSDSKCCFCPDELGQHLPMVFRPPGHAEEVHQKVPKGIVISFCDYVKNLFESVELFHWWGWVSSSTQWWEGSGSKME